jgi:pimeloyl-ACP methyl ester carboxylesterase
MPTFDSFDGTTLSATTLGTGDPLVVVPGGPMQASVYLGDIGGLDAHRTLHLLDLRGTGGSAVPAEPATFRVDRQVGDVEAFRTSLGLDPIDLLGHSAGASLAILYAARYPERIRRLVLVTPSLRLFQFGMAEEYVREAAALRAGRPGMDVVEAALDRVFAGIGTDEDDLALTPLSYGRWDTTAQEHASRREEQTNAEGMRHYYADGLPDPGAVTKALDGLAAPVLIIAGEYDYAPRPAVAAQAAELFFPRAETAVVPGGGHFPWLDDPTALVTAITAFLSSP